MFFLVTLSNIHRFKKNFTQGLSTKPFFILVINNPTTPIATLPCFADINVSQGSVATYATCGGIFNINLPTNLPKNLPGNFLKIGLGLTELWS